ncbi:helix-turn-helix domain-containing protein [Pseudohalioglobus sediminis]|uniref:Helix-turn-helix domain-containing protein n=1 Tax=Pseudohalioglobus sediminis TaxID=2606449 RepID=A0A5B0WUJ5_9GAMM|nr:helix-turn-helix domain-containing protein [Pseudohalioglobus sediminis]KAA1189539.1 helix-turn-helix domain-containing protein [Pseudohalioglobus sediminis]
MTETSHSISVRLDSVEELSEVVPGSIWNFDMRQLEAGRAPVAIDAFATTSFLLLKTQLNGRTHQMGELAKDSYTFGLPVRDQAPVKFGDREVGSDTITLFDSTEGLDAVSESDFGAFTASFAAEPFEAMLLRLGLGPEAFRARLGSRHMRVPPGRAQALRVLMLDLLNRSLLSEDVPPSLLQGLQAQIAEELALAFSASGDQVADRTKNRSRALRAALHYIHDKLDESITVDELCRASACSISTLERAFRERFGIGPKRYLMAVRLSGVRKALLCSSREESIGDVAARMGFWHMSKLAADYKRMFGELPSHTSRAA